MSDDRVRLHVEAFVVSVSSSVFLGNSVQKMYNSAPLPYINETLILGAQAQIYLDFSQNKSSILKLYF